MIRGGMVRGRRMCQNCPFRARLSADDRNILVALEPDEFPCHEEAGYTTTNVQCRGHWEARRKARKAITATKEDTNA